MYVLKRIEDGKFVSKPGSKWSYTFDLKKARIFSSKENAERDKCGNEIVVSVHDILH